MRKNQHQESRTTKEARSFSTTRPAAPTIGPLAAQARPAVAAPTARPLAAQARPAAQARQVASTRPAVAAPYSKATNSSSKDFSLIKASSCSSFQCTKVYS